MAKIKFIKPPVSISACKATIHKTGKLGFSKGAAERMNINQKVYVKIGINTEDKEDNNLYIMILENDDEETLSISKAGHYFYANTKTLFDEMGIDYRSKKVIYDVIEINIEGQRMFKFIRREKDRK